MNLSADESTIAHRIGENLLMVLIIEKYFINQLENK